MSDISGPSEVVADSTNSRVGKWPKIDRPSDEFGSFSRFIYCPFLFVLAADGLLILWI